MLLLFCVCVTLPGQPALWRKSGHGRGGVGSLGLLHKSVLHRHGSGRQRAGAPDWGSGVVAVRVMPWPWPRARRDARGGPATRPRTVPASRYNLPQPPSPPSPSASLPPAAAPFFPPNNWKVNGKSGLAHNSGGLSRSPRYCKAAAGTAAARSPRSGTERDALPPPLNKNYLLLTLKVEPLFPVG